MMRVDPFAVFLGIVVVIGRRARAAAVALVPASRGPRGPAEYFALLLLSASGMLMMTTANDLIVVFVALEVLSIPLYVLAAFDRRRLRVAGGRPQVLRPRGVLVGGVPLRHRPHLRRDRHHVAHGHRRRSSRPTRCSSRAPCSSGLGLLLVGLGFKVAAVPFHMWTPDVYQGAPTPGHRVHGRGHQGRRRSRRSCASLTTAFPPVPRRLASDRLGARGALDARRVDRARCVRPTSSARSPTRRSPTPATS